MSKSSNKNFRVEDRKYTDGYGVDKRKDAVIDKRKERRFERALRVKNVDDLLEDDMEDSFDMLEDWEE
jgi:hypothetical protein